MEEKFLKLRRFNLIMGGLHLIQGILMLILATLVIQKVAEFSPAITLNYIQYNSTTQALEVTSRNLFTLPFGILVACFLLISALAHGLIAIPKRLNLKYQTDLSHGINQFRWYEYAISSSIMIVLIATLFGIHDIASLILIFAANATMNLFGLLMEKFNAGASGTGNVKWSPFVFGSLIGIAPWIAILLYLFGTGNYGNVPWFVWAILFSYFACFCTFPINMILQYKGVGKWKDYLYGERVYIILSLVAKSILAWLVLFGAMQPS